MRFISVSTLKAKGILGMNRRNTELIGQHNPRKRYPMVDNKRITKQIAAEAGIAVTELYATIEWQSQLGRLDELLAPYEGFVIKPTHGSGGKGIVVIVGRDNDAFLRADGVRMTLSQLRDHCSNILSGLYSLGGRYDTVIIEKLVEFDPVFDHYSFEGVPDIRIIVYKGYPLMAMMRCPTHQSSGKANLHQGAVGVGIDLATGRALHAVMHNRRVTHHPDTGHDFLDLQVPQWETLLHIAASCYEMTGLGYLGTDIVFDRNVGPLLLELNARPGLAIQIANGKGEVHRIAAVDREHLKRDAQERVVFSMDVLSEI